ncbi:MULTISPECIES: hypothetical protein [Actinoalloteichus]|uniref:Uncharacterized protein n=1 Tax=Actinoalloteichus fjordicus TaxID=1612552 RepID=A0AAC9LE76_9PSEU|nr:MULTISPECIES: hypothetical protein [Actinoalloteichus]APU15092.1 hypothetical protein UA74_15195 [Actinoalloteichus fjordicus]APU21160.1 hypothetical protein UA75_15755 [Actinoalloteichus sp. GBA129-24]
MGILRLIAPWRVARRLFGGYGPRSLILFDAAAYGRAGEAVDSAAPLLERLLQARVILSLGVLVLLVQLVDGGPDAFIAGLFEVTSATVISGIPGVLAIIVFCLIRAERGHRRRAAREMRPTIVIGLGALLLFLFTVGNQIPGWPAGFSFQGLIYAVMPRDFDLSGGRLLLSLVALPVLLWFIGFGLCAAYLIHNNSFGVAAGSVLDPLVGIWLACSVAGFHLVGEHLDGGITTASIVAATTGALGAGAISIWELRTMLRAGASFARGPWGSPRQAEADPAAG